MTEIKVKDARLMDADDAQCLLNWRNWTNESLVYGLTMQQLLDLYHASGEYVSLEGWLDEDRTARKTYNRIVGKALALA